MKKLIALLLCLLSFCVFLFAFTACTKEPIIGSYCGQIDDSEEPMFAYWDIEYKDDKLYVSAYWRMQYGISIFDEEFISTTKIANSGPYSGNPNNEVPFITLTKTDTGYIGTAKCSMLDTAGSIKKPSTYTLTLNGDTLTIECKEDATGNTQTFTLKATTKTQWDYYKEIKNELISAQ